MKKIISLLALSLLLTGCDALFADEGSGQQTITFDNGGDSNTQDTPSDNTSNTPSTPSEKGKGVDNPYTVAEAVNKCGSNPSGEFYVKGKVSSIINFNSSYGDLTFEITDNDKTTADEVLRAYQCKNINGAKFTSRNELNLEVEVIIKGKLTVYVTSKYSVNEITNCQIMKMGTGGINMSIPDLPNNPTNTQTLTFDSSFIPTSSGSNYVWDVDNVKFTLDQGSQWSSAYSLDPFRFYVGTYLHIEVKTGTIKTITFNTVNNYGFAGGEVVTDGVLSVGANNSIVYAKNTNIKKIKIHNSNRGDTSAKQQVRFTSVTIEYYV